RDWGWAPEYVEAMWAMLQQPTPDDFVIATGKSSSLEEFVEAAFSNLNLKWQEHVAIDKGLLRPTDLAEGIANPAKAKQFLNWQAKYKMYDVVEMMIKAESNKT